MGGTSKKIAKKNPFPYFFSMTRPAFRDREESSAGYSLMDSALGICVPMACGVLVCIFILLVNQ